jgi:type IV secretory pathway VirJ component
VTRTARCIGGIFLGAQAMIIAGAATDSAPAAAQSAAAAPATTAAMEPFSDARYGEIRVYRDVVKPRDVVLFFSGDGGWNLGVVTMAQHLAAKGSLVAGIDIRRYLEQLERTPDQCVSPAADAENLSRSLQSKLHLEQYLQPTLVGYSSGATLVYAALVQAHEGMFKGALSIGFCPDLDLKKPLCRGSGIESTPRYSIKGELQGVDFLPAKALPGKWISLQGQLDQVCPFAAAQSFIAKVPGGEMILLPKVGHGYSVEKNWVPQFVSAFERITAVTAKQP